MIKILNLMLLNHFKIAVYIILVHWSPDHGLEVHTVLGPVVEVLKR